MQTKAATSSSPSAGSEWFASWFDSAHYHTLYAHRDEQEAARLVDRLVERLRPAKGASILDLGCGAGRHATELATRGFDVTGLDLSAESIRLARQNEGANLRFLRQDMRLPFRVGAFDYILSLFTSFGYFDDPADDVTVIHNVAGALKPGGVFVIDYLNARHAEAYLKPEDTIERDGVTYRISRRSDARHIFKRIAIDDRRVPAPLEYTERVTKLTLEDFRFMLEVCNMTVEQTFGDYALAPFDVETSPRLVIVARMSDTPARKLPAGEFLADAADGLRRHAEVGGQH